jgi:DHA2 family metal-tetracycline-proton antiporter-like MFS transporter
MEKAARTAGNPYVKKSITFPLSFIIFFSVLNGTTFNVAVPDIAAGFGLMPSEVSWVMTAYIVVFAIGSLVYGKLADIYSVRMLTTLGLVLLNAGSLMGFFSAWYPMVVAARILQAVGGSAIPALAMLVATRYFPPGMKGSLLGVIASTVALAAGIGPMLGGFISGALHWRYLFLFTLLTLPAIPVLRGLLPGGAGGQGRFDRMGAALMGGGAASLLFYVTEGLWWLLPAGIGLALWFALHIRRVEAPFIKPAIFLNPSYRNTILTTFLSMGTIFGMLFMVPIMLRELNGLGSGWIGLVMFPGAMAAALVGRGGGRLADRKGPAFVFYMGAAFIVSGFLLLSTFAGSAPWAIAMSLVVSYLGFAFLQSSLPHTVSSALPSEHTGVGMGVYNLFFFISGAFSAAGIGRLLDLGDAGFCLNPANACGPAWIYSNIFVLLAVLVLLAWALFCRTYRQPMRD